MSRVHAAEGEQVAKGVSLPRDWSSMRGLRQARRLSQTQLAELAGVSERTIRAIEGGAVERPQHESLRRIAAVLAYGEGHGQRLVEQWTGTSAERTPEEIGVPDWDSLYRRMRFRSPEDGGQLSSLVNHVTIGSDRMMLRQSVMQAREPMSVTGPPVIWSLEGGSPFDVSTVRFEVTTGGVIDDFFVHGDVAALAIRPDPAIAQRGPFVLEYASDYSNAVSIDRPPDHEQMMGTLWPLRLATTIVHFMGKPPERLWAVQGETAASAERVARLQVGPDGGAQLCLHDFIGVYGIQWEWDDGAS
jgi:transcriptional regulator with XRE-family HTH domain